MKRRTKYDGTGTSFLKDNAGGIGAGAGLLSSLVDQTGFGKTKGGSALSGGISGAAALAPLGPIAMGAGALVGGISGLLKAGAEQKAQNKEDLAHQFRVNSLLASNLPGQNSYVPTFRNGGSFIPLELLGFIKANGGSITGTINDQKNTTYYPTGGTHQQNPNGGIPIGKDALTEQGEFRYDSKTKGSYIFSNRF